MKRMLVLAGLLAFIAGSALAQTPSIPPPYNVPLGAVITNNNQGIGTVNSALQNNVAYNGIICTFNSTSKSASPNATISIQMQDSASATFQSLVTSGTISLTATPTSVVIYPGIQTSSLPSGMVAFNGRLPRFWRLQQVITSGGGASPTIVAGTVGCDLLK